MADQLRAGIVGPGFVGGVHARAVTSSGHRVAGVVDSTPAASAAAADRLGADRAFDSVAELVWSDEVDVVHVCVPNALHAEVTHEALAAGKHVICEKPLATSVEDARGLADGALEAQVVAAVPFVYRFYPSVREARARVQAGETGALRVLHGSYLQDWLSARGDDDWRVDPRVGGASRAFGDIGVHWCDLMEFVTGHRIVRLASHLLTAYPQRGTHGTVRTEDAATVMFTTDQGAAGSVVLSQVSPGRKNRLWFSFDGERESLSFDQENAEVLWIGEREQEWLVRRGSPSASADAARLSRLPAGHPQGYQDAFNAFVDDVYAEVRGDLRPGRPTFDDGVRAAVLTQAVLESAEAGGWVDVD